MIPFMKEKEESIESFLRFAEGGEPPRWPLEIFLEISNICNLKCAMCTTFSALSPLRKRIIKGVKRGFMDIEDILPPMEELFMHALQVHAFGYGEPTIHPGFTDIINHLSKYGVMVDFFTNGMLIDEKMSEFLVSSNVSKLTISMSGSDKFTYESIYIGGDFEKVITGMKRLDATKKRQGTEFPKIEVNSIAFNHHVEKLPEFVELMAECGVSIINLKPLATYDAVPELHCHRSIPRPDVEMLILERAKKIAQKYGIIIGSKPYEGLLKAGSDSGTIRHHGKGQLSSEYVPLEKIAELGRERQIYKSDDNGTKNVRAKLLDAAPIEHFQWSGAPCPEPFKTFYVAYSGDVYPCCFKNSAASLGNIKDTSGEDIWRGDVFSEIRRGVRERNEYPAVLCKRCLSSRTYPVVHATANKLSLYGRWCQASYGESFSHLYLDRAKQLPPSIEFSNDFEAQRKITENN